MSKTLDKKFGLVIEGGGYRACYIAGALKWLNDNDLHFSYCAAISSGAYNEFFYAAEMDEENYNISINGVAEKGIFGLQPFIKGKGLFDFERLRTDYLMRNFKPALDKLKASDRDVEVGLYNMDKQELQYFSKKDFDDEGMYFKAACVLPLTNKMTELKGEKFLDGGIRTMVSIERSLETGHSKNLVIVTKDKGYVRKPNGFVLTNLLRLVYHKYKTMLKTLDDRVDTYYHEMGLVDQLEQKGEALLIRPSKDTGVGRFSGTNQQMKDMYALGYQDMEEHKAEIYKLLELE